MGSYVLLLHYGIDLKNGFRIVGPYEDVNEAVSNGKDQKDSNLIGNFLIHELIPPDKIRREIEKFKKE